MFSTKLGVRPSIVVVTCAAAVVLLAGCATLKPPQLFVDGLKVDKVRLTGVAMDVRFRIHNTNPRPLDIENFEYELKLNGVRLGRGYYGERVRLEGFGEAKIVSRFQLNMLALPAGVQEILTHDRARAQAKGTFYLRKGDGLRELDFDTDAEVELRD